MSLWPPACQFIPIQTRGVVAAPAPRQSVACLIYLVCLTSWTLYGQARSPFFGPGAEPDEIAASAGTYSLEWRQRYERLVGLVPSGVSDDRGALWLVTLSGPGKPEELTKIDPDGQLVANYNLNVPLNPFEWVGYWSPAASGPSVGVLASLVSGGRNQTFEGAFFVPVAADGPRAPVRIAGPGPQFPTIVGTGDGGFIAAGDQEPLSFIKLDSNGGLLWRRSFSPKLMLPTVSVSSRAIFAVSQGGAYVLLQVLDLSGRVLRSKRISAMQGAVVADAEGGCSLLFSTRAGGEHNAVFLLTLDRDLRELNRVTSPLVGWGGRTYQIVSSPHGHLIIGEGPERHPQEVVPKKVLAEFDRSGKLMWEQSITSLETPLLTTFRSGFYLVRDRFAAKSFDVEKYAY